MALSYGEVFQIDRIGEYGNNSREICIAIEFLRKIPLYICKCIILAYSLSLVNNENLITQNILIIFTSD